MARRFCLITLFSQQQQQIKWFETIKLKSKISLSLSFFLFLFIYFNKPELKEMKRIN